MQSCTVPCIAMCIASLQSWAQLHYTVPHTSSPHLIQQFLGSRLRSGPIWIRVKLWLSQIRLKIRIIFNGESAPATKFRVSTKLTIAPCLAATQLMSLPEWIALLFYPLCWQIQIQIRNWYTKPNSQLNIVRFALLCLLYLYFDKHKIQETKLNSQLLTESDPINVFTVPHWEASTTVPKSFEENQLQMMLKAKTKNYFVMCVIFEPQSFSQN